MKLYALILFIAVSAPVASARVGDTEEELIKRLGPPVSRASERHHAEGRSIEFAAQLRFQQEDWSITCDVVDARCVRASYSKLGKWSDEHIRTVLTVNAQGDRWEEITKPAVKTMQRQWKRADGAVATWVVTGGMTVVTPAYERAKAVADAKLKAAAKKVPKL